MSNHNKIRPVDKDKLNGEYKILFSRPQTKNTNIPKEYIGLQIYINKFKAEEALLKAVKASKLNYTINKGEGAFYGPKVEFVLRDAIGGIGNVEHYK